MRTSAETNELTFEETSIYFLELGGVVETHHAIPRIFLPPRYIYIYIYT